MVFLPNCDMLFTERMGDLRHLHQGRLRPLPIQGVPASYHSVYDGLRDIVIDPDYQTNQTIYLLVSEGTFAERHAAVYRARYDGADALENVERIFRSKEDVGGVQVIASRMIFLADGTLLFAVAQDHAQQSAQQLDSHTGKSLRINRDGSVPNDNPFVSTPGALPEIWSYGHRVPTGLVPIKYQGRESMRSRR